MWSWLKGLLAGKGGGCIAANASASTTLTPLGEPKISSRSFKSIQDLAEHNQATDGRETQLNAGGQQQPQGLCTPLHAVVGQQDTAGSKSTDQQLGTAQEFASQLHVSAGRYIYSGGKPVGFANTVTRYQENRPLKPDVTPFEARMEAKIAEEEVAAMAAAAAAARSRPSSTDGTNKQLFNLDDTGAQRD